MDRARDSSAAGGHARALGPARCLTLTAAAVLALAGCGGSGVPSQRQLSKQIQQEIPAAEAPLQQAASQARKLLKATGGQAQQQVSAAQQIQAALAQGTSSLNQAASAEKAAIGLAQADRERQWLVNHGISANAVVLAVHDTGTTDTGPGVLAVTGSYGAVEYVLRLRVTVPGKPAYVTSVDQPVGPDISGGLHPGAVVPVKADPRRLAYVLVG
jgi:hypothetical protein